MQSRALTMLDDLRERADAELRAYRRDGVQFYMRGGRAFVNGSQAQLATMDRRMAGLSGTVTALLTIEHVMRK